jgi:UDP-N-acetyl-D-mannosaminuronic acid transferase (WecB/TagA/CpsF family)
MIIKMIIKINSTTAVTPMMIYNVKSSSSVDVSVVPDLVVENDGFPVVVSGTVVKQKWSSCNGLDIFHLFCLQWTP